MHPKDNFEADWAAAAADPDYELPLPEGLTMRFRRIPRGSFLMGSRGVRPEEEPIHRVEIGAEFWLGKFVVTQAQYAAVVRGCPGLKLEPDPSHFKGLNRPVEQVSWDDAVAWCEGLRAWPSLPGDVAAIRLPFEAEWEYACRAGTETEYHNGDGVAALSAVGWFDQNSVGQTHAVDESVRGIEERHPAGLVGMHGNVWECCRDVWDPHAYRKREVAGKTREWALADAGSDATHYFSRIKPGEVPDRVLRGGSWDNSAGGCRSAYRLGRRPDVRFRIYGFRVCLVRGPKAEPEKQKQPAKSQPATGVGSRGTRLENDGAGGDGKGSPTIDLSSSKFPPREK